MTKKVKNIVEKIDWLMRIVENLNSSKQIRKQAQKELDKLNKKRYE